MTHYLPLATLNKGEDLKVLDSIVGIDSKFNADGVEIKEEETGAIITGTSGEKYIYLGELLYGDSSTTHSCLDKTNHKANIKTVFATCYNEAGEIISSAELALK